MKGLLVWPKARTDPDWGGDLGAVAEPLALEYLASVAAQEGHEARILDLRLHPDDLESTLGAYQPQFVGVTAYSMHVLAALAVCRRVKELLPGCHTVVGGHHATFLPEDFFVPEVDFVVSGEGTAPLRALLRALAGGQPVVGIPGLWHRCDGRFVGGRQDPFDVDALPPPDRSVTRRDRERYFIDWMRPVALLRSTVGCPYRCSFCSLWRLMGGKYYMRDVAAVAGELAAVEEEFVFLVDDEAFIHRHRMLELAAAIAAAGVRKRLFAYCRIDTLLRHREVIQAWRDVGLERLFVGIDAISDKDLKEYRKKVKIAQIEEGLTAADELGVEIFAQFVANTDYTRRDFSQLARFVEHHDIRYPSFTVLTPLPGTDLLAPGPDGDFPDVVERQPNGRPNWDLFDCQNAVTATVLPKEEFRAEYRNLFHRFRGRYAQYRRGHVAAGQPVRAGVPAGAW